MKKVRRRPLIFVLAILALLVCVFSPIFSTNAWFIVGDGQELKLSINTESDATYYNVSIPTGYSYYIYGDTDLNNSNGLEISVKEGSMIAVILCAISYFYYYDDVNWIDGYYSTGKLSVIGDFHYAFTVYFNNDEEYSVYPTAAFSYLVFTVSDDINITINQYCGLYINFCDYEDEYATPKTFNYYLYGDETCYEIQAGLLEDDDIDPEIVYLEPGTTVAIVLHNPSSILNYYAIAWEEDGEIIHVGDEYNEYITYSIEVDNENYFLTEDFEASYSDAYYIVFTLNYPLSLNVYVG